MHVSLGASCWRLAVALAREPAEDSRHLIEVVADKRAGASRGAEHARGACGGVAPLAACDDLFLGACGDTDAEPQQLLLDSGTVVVLVEGDQQVANLVVARAWPLDSCAREWTDGGRSGE
jgi:hypothetical protein